MLSNRILLLATTAVAPALWGTTYLTTTLYLPVDRPLLAATARALPAGVLLLLLCRRLPRGHWWWKSWVLGILNIGAFFALLFIAAYRLPGGVAAVIGGLQPLIVALLATRVLHERLTGRVVAAGSTGVFGVCLIVLQAQARLDAIGILAAVAGTLSMASGIVLSKKWGQPASPLTTTAWQLITGGLTLLVILLTFEGLPTAPLTAQNILGYGYLAGVGTALAYVLWFRGIARLPTSTTAFLGLLSPVMAILLGWVIAGEALLPLQIAGVVIVLGSITAGIVPKAAQRPELPASGGSLRGRRMARSE
ncbi:EamA family transporter [Cryobacterium algoricola]|uniref:EamA family transporter n=1 Tax=Cryobacterium algoricola TaxID=1259183 RepID=A0ABY2I8Y8_9MICO|nr:EamA family transporter [Cryobacterium algoricola]TFB84131.1 EamA family transporter [Cryobacterium algoricola]